MKVTNGIGHIDKQLELDWLAETTETHFMKPKINRLWASDRQTGKNIGTSDNGFNTTKLEAQVVKIGIMTAVLHLRKTLQAIKTKYNTSKKFIHMIMHVTARLKIVGLSRLKAVYKLSMNFVNHFMNNCIDLPLFPRNSALHPETFSLQFHKCEPNVKAP